MRPQSAENIHYNFEECLERVVRFKLLTLESGDNFIFSSEKRGPIFIE